jgi:asparagine synthase (glutamine-hydrolysing)
MFHNSATALYALTEEPMTVSEWGLVDQTAFRRELMAYIVAMEDPNANPGLRYHYIRGVCDLETWLRRFSCPRAHLDAQLKMRPLRRLV